MADRSDDDAIVAAAVRVLVSLEPSWRSAESAVADLRARDWLSIDVSANGLADLIEALRAAGAPDWWTALRAAPRGVKTTRRQGAQR